MASNSVTAIFLYMFFSAGQIDFFFLIFYSMQKIFEKFHRDRWRKCSGPHNRPGGCYPVDVLCLPFFPVLGIQI